MIIGFIYERRHTRQIDELGGIWKPAPVLTALFIMAMFAGIGLPGFSGFVGEFLALAGTFISERPYAVIAAVGVVLAAVYMLWAFQRVFTGKPTGENAKMTDATKREILLVAPLLVLSLFLGLYPKPVLERIEPTVRQKIAFLEQKTDYREKRPDGFGSNKFGGGSYIDLAKKALKEQR